MQYQLPLAIAVLAFAALILPFTHAHAFMGGMGSSQVQGGGGGGMGNWATGGGYSAYGGWNGPKPSDNQGQNNSVIELAKLIQQRNELNKKIDALQAKMASSSKSGTWQERFCAGDGEYEIDARQNICDRWRGNGTGVQGVKVVLPNGGIAGKTGKDGAVKILWKNTTSDTTVDIGYKKGSSTAVTWIAKDVTGKIVEMDVNSGDVLGTTSKKVADKATSTHKKKESKPREGMSAKTYQYLWKDAPLGKGYRIVITAQVDDKKFVDESDRAFEIKKTAKSEATGAVAPTDTSDEDGSVLGAETSLIAEMNSALDDIEDTLIEIMMTR